MTLETFNEGAEFWRKHIGVNTIAYDTANVLKKPKGGQPIIGWKEFEDRAMTDKEFDELKRENKFKLGIAIMPGKVWHRDGFEGFLFGIDIDSPAAMKAFLTTEDGKQVSLDYFTKDFIIEQHEDNLCRAHIVGYSTKKLVIKSKIRGIEIFTEPKHLMNVSPSMHENGHQYVRRGVTLPTVDNSNAMQKHLNNVFKRLGGKHQDKYLYEGERNTKLFAIFCKLLDNNKGKEREEIKKLAFAKNQKLCKPPLPDSEVEGIWNSAVNTVNSHVENDDEEKESPITLATEHLMNQYHFVTIEENKEILYYEDGVYVSGGDVLIEKTVEEFLEYEVSNSRLAEIKGHVMRRTYHKLEEFDADINIINLENGLYKIEEDVLLPHDPYYLSMNQKPITYVKGAKPKLLGKFLSEVVYPRDVRTAVDVMSYTFRRDNDIEAVFKLYGHGANGKTVFTGIITKLHGDKNVSNVSLQEMLKDTFALSDLENKDVNIDNELGSQTIKESSILKKLTAGSRNRIRIQRKNQRAYDTMLYTKLFFNVNTMPDVSDKSDAYSRRVYIITFPNRFEGKAEDPQLGKKLTTSRELSGIFNVCMVALRRILKTKKIFLTEKTIDERREKYERSVNPIVSFIRDAVLPQSSFDMNITKEDFYDAYVKYCEKYTLPPEKYIQFCRKVKSVQRHEIEFDIKEDRVTIEGKKISCWKGIALIPEYDPKTLQTTLSLQ